MRKIRLIWIALAAPCYAGSGLLIYYIDRAGHLADACVLLAGVSFGVAVFFSYLAAGEHTRVRDLDRHFHRHGGPPHIFRQHGD